MPNIHPLLIHFPIALLTMSFLFDAAGLLARRDDLIRSGWWMMFAGTIGLFATVMSGILAEGGVIISEAARQHFEIHEQAAFFVAGIYALLFLWRVASRSSLPPRREWIFILGSFLGVIGVWLTAWHGGELVFRFGVGVWGR